MTTMPFLDRVLDLVKRDYKDPPPVINACKLHASTKLSERSIDCALCAHDVREFARAAIKANEWLNTWVEEARALIVEWSSAKIDQGTPVQEEDVSVVGPKGSDELLHEGVRYVRVDSPNTATATVALELLREFVESRISERSEP